MGLVSVHDCGPAIHNSVCYNSTRVPIKHYNYHLSYYTLCSMCSIVADSPSTVDREEEDRVNIGVCTT